MKFALFSLLEQPEGHKAAQVFSKIVEQAEAAEELGFEATWLAEHHFTDYGILPSPAVLAAAIAQRTKRLRIGTACAILPFHDPRRVAEDYAVVDVLSNGRLDFGVGRGYQPAEFSAFGIPMSESRTRFAEALDVIEGLWTHEVFSFQGDHFTIDELSLYPRPIQSPPPIWVAAVSPETFEMTARAGRPFLSAPQITPLSKIRAGYDLYRKIYLENGHDPSRMTLPLQRQVYVGTDEQDSFDSPSEGTMWYQRKNASRMARKGGTSTESYEFYQKAQSHLEQIEYKSMYNDGVLLFDVPEKLVARIRVLQEELDLNYLMCWMNVGGLPQKKVLASMERFAKEVMPHFTTTATDDSVAASAGSSD